MSHPYLMLSNTNARYQQMLENAETERKYRQIKAKSYGLLQGVADSLISAGQKLMAQGRPSHPSARFVVSK